MKIVMFTICTHAEHRTDGLYIQGAITNLVVKRVPAQFEGPIVTRMFFPAEEEGPFKGFMRVIDPDGQEVLRAAVDMDVPVSESDGTGVYADSVGGFKLSFLKLGEYQFHIGRIGGEVFEFPLYVSLKQAP